MLLRGSINIVNPLGEHNPGNYWPYDETNRVRSTRCYDGNRTSCTRDVCCVLNSGLGKNELANDK